MSDDDWDCGRSHDSSGGDGFWLGYLLGSGGGRGSPKESLGCLAALTLLILLGAVAVAVDQVNHQRKHEEHERKLREQQTAPCGKCGLVNARLVTAGVCNDAEGCKSRFTEDKK